MPYHASPNAVSHDQTGEVRRLLEQMRNELNQLSRSNSVVYSLELMGHVDRIKSLHKRAYSHLLRAHAANFVALHTYNSRQQEDRNGTLQGGEWNGSPNGDILREREQVYKELEALGNPDGLSLVGLSSAPSTLETAELASGRLSLERSSAA